MLGYLANIWTLKKFKISPGFQKLNAVDRVFSGFPMD